ncbi:MAG: holo-ACP synthase [Gammaproteobacteria bacterium]|nr:holo-ACP synthase [Gammaproteobacteria bacterium]|tara:strand:- start:1395 stop:1787 length:393 start_codon:yes stop_codon:yes gene_type:complete
MIRGIGIDLVDNNRIRKIHNKYSDNFAKKILSDDEYTEYLRARLKINYLAKHFATKEAFSKAAGTGLFRKGLSPSVLNISHDAFGKPIFKPNKKYVQFLNDLNIKNAHISITDIDKTTAAIVILESNEIS